MNKQSKQKINMYYCAIALTLALNTCLVAQVAGSSYLDLIPTAKLALNKLQQTLAPATVLGAGQAPAHSQQQQQQVTNATSAGESLAALGPPTTTTTTTDSSAGGQAPVQTDNSDDQSNSNGNSNDIDSDRRSPTTDSEPDSATLVISSTAATDFDPTEASTEPARNNERPNESARDSAAAAASAKANTDSTADGAPLATTTTTTTAAAPEAGSDSGAASRAAPNEQVSSATNNADANQLPTLLGVDGKPVATVDEASIRETELAAIAAVDASIGFGSNSIDLFAATTDTCYDEYGNARYCEPEFENIAYERPVEASSECGQPASRFCTAYANENNDIIRNCHICDAKHPKKRHPAAYLSDLNDPNNPTCWVSAPLSGVTAGMQTTHSNNNAQANNNINNNNDMTQQSNYLQRNDNVSLTLNLGKAYEITYISVQFCSARPDSMAIYKSSDFGQNWQAYQYYSSNCRQVYNRPQSPTPNRAAGDLSAICTNYAGPQTSAAAASNSNGSAQAAGAGAGAGVASHWPSSRVAFSTLEGVRGKLGGASGAPAQPQQQQQSGAEWTSATNIRIVLDRYLNGSAAQTAAAFKQVSSSGVGAKNSQLIGVGKPVNQLGEQVSAAAVTSAQQRRLISAAGASANESAGAGGGSYPSASQQQHVSGLQLPPSAATNQLISPSDTYNYAIADLVVGGRCKCNGHASRCTHTSEGRLQCDCRHNTAGRDCERCAPFHFDRPWKAATQLDANPCQPCNCNGHSRKCRFDPELYELSGGRSGGVCINCRDNTAGRHCHYCKEGFTRDLSKPMTDKDACRECDCHPLGSLGRVCNQTTGQCPCKEGVTGLQCTRCAPGYQQSSSPSEPCIKLPENDINYEPALVVDSDPPQSADQTPVIETTETVSAIDNSGPADSQNNNNNNRIDPATPVGGRSNDKFGKSYLSSDNIGPAAGPGDSGFTDDDQDRPGADNSNDGFVDSLAARKRNQQRQQWLMYQHNQYDSYHPRHRYGSNPPNDEPASVDEGGRTDDESLYMPRAKSQSYGAAIDLDDDLAGNYNGPMDTYDRTLYNRWQSQDRMMGSGHADYRRRQQLARGRAQAASGMANIDDNYDDQLPNSLGMDAAYGSADDAAFNLISPRRRINLNSGTGSRSRKQGAASTGGSRRRISPSASDDDGRPQQSHTRHQLIPMATAVPLSCGDCQNNTRRISSRQFCHLDYAIKATILSRHRAADWTRFDVEIIDIFKSPQLRTNPMIMSGSYIDNMVQSDEPVTTNNKSSNTKPMQSIMDPRSSMSFGNQHQQHTSSTGLHHRLRVGTVQPIWIPTEDLSCNCPRLKPRSTYLLMGLVDSKENSANSIQLDRHSVALEWRSILQEKLIRYQRRYARGRC